MSTEIKTKAKADEFLTRKVSGADKSLARLEAQIADLDEKVEAALAEGDDDLCAGQKPDDQPSKPAAVTIWGVPFSCLTLAGTLQHIDRLIAAGDPGYFITANLNYNMLTDRHPELRAVNEKAAFIVCDGMPMVWYSRFTRRRLPERVAGSELIYALNKWAAAKGHRVFFLGGAPGVAQAAADKLAQRYPGLQIAGVESPPFRPLSEAEQVELVGRIRAARPDIVYIAFGQPKGEVWMFQNYEKIGAPVCVQIGASFDFVAGGVARAPRWLQRAGLEWFYRLLQEPRRLVGRYFGNAVFLLKAVGRDLFTRREARNERR